MKRGKLIVLEGGDASGKATQTKLLLKKLKKQGYKTAAIAFPQYYTSFYGKLIGRYLKGEFGDVNQINPYLASLLYACDRWSVKDKLLEWLKQGRIVVSNRYVSASEAFMAAKLKTKSKQENFIKWLDKLEFNVNKMPKPDLTIYLDVPLEISRKLVIKKGYRKYMKGVKLDIHERNKPYQKRVYVIFKRLSKRPKWIHINCTKNNKLLSKKEISNKIWAIVSKKI